MNHLMSIRELGRDTVLELLDSADFFKESRHDPKLRNLLLGKSIALLFEKASTRTRISLETAVYELGGNPLVISGASSQLSRGEPIEDTARVLGRMVQAVTFRTFSEEHLRKLAQYSGVPVLNALTDQGHPLQILADLQTVRREFGTLEGLKCTWLGDGNNMSNSWIEAAGLLKLQLDLAVPEGFDPAPQLVSWANSQGATVRVLRDPKAACQGAHVLSTDVFASMGQESEAQERLKKFEGLRLTQALVNAADKKSIVLHCLPAHRGEEIDADVLEGPNSRVWDQAEARLHTAKAALCWALNVSAR